MGRIVVLGGCGDVGSHVVKELVASFSGSVVIADYRVAKARAMAAQLGAKAEAAFVDANDESSLVKVLEGADAAVGCIGPFYRYAVPVARAAVRAGVNYVDICDDYGPVDELLSLDDAARAAGMTLITGLGWTPGLTNLLAKKGASELDEVEEIRISWAGSAADSTGLAVIMHVFYAVTGDVPTYRDGAWVKVPAGTETETVEFPEPLGKVPVYHCGHPEPLTIPRYIKARTVSLKGALVPDWNNKLAPLFARLGLIGTPEKNLRTARIVHAIEGIFRVGGVPASGARVDVTGLWHGTRRTVSFAAAETMGKITGIPAAIGARWLAEGRLPKGAYAPEGCLEPDPFLEELAWRGVRYQRLV
jgi:saccharopine dehydrogenase-like NADP-dependent oxidoreductase